jgi:hypothetical protein
VDGSEPVTRDWAVADVCFSAEQHAAAREVVHRDLGGPDAVGLAFLAGSLAVGLGHGTSDVDLYAVSDSLPEHDLCYEAGGVTVHVSMLRPRSVHRLVELGSRFEATGGARDQILLEFKKLLSLVRLATGWPIVTTPQWTSTMESLRRDVVRKILLARHANIFAALAEDVAGALASGDRYTAVGASTLALEAAAEATLAAADDLCVGPKFLLRRLARTPVTAAWAPTLWRLLNQAFPDSVDDRVREVAEHRLRVGNLLVSCGVLDGWDKPLDRLPAPGQETDPLRSPYFAPIRFADGLALMGPGRGYEVNEATVRLWRDAAPGDTGPGVSALTAISAFGTNPPLPGTPRPADPVLPPELRIRWAPRYMIHPEAEDPAPAQDVPA